MLRRRARCAKQLVEVFGQALSKQLETLTAAAKAVAGKLPKSWAALYD